MLMVYLSAVLVVIMVYFGGAYLWKNRRTGITGREKKITIIPKLSRFRSQILAARKGLADSQSPPLTKAIEFPKTMKGNRTF